MKANLIPISEKCVTKKIGKKVKSFSKIAVKRWENQRKSLIIKENHEKLKVFCFSLDFVKLNIEKCFEKY